VKRPVTSLILSALLLHGCTVGPNYKRPVAAVPDSYRGLTPEQLAKGEAASLGDEMWWEVFKDTQLQSLIRTAVENNYDVRIASTRILQAQARYGITRADQFPTVTGGGSSSAQQIPRQKGVPEHDSNATSLNIAGSWEIDFWGKFRRATESSRAQILSSEWGKRAVLNTLVSDVAAAYFQLLEFDLELQISKTALQSRNESLRLANILSKGGATSLLDVRQSEQLVYNAAALIPSTEQRIEQQENYLNFLLGQNPGPIQRGLLLTEQYRPPAIPAGLPSTLLERRPDILSAEQQLISANAQIGVARSYYYPQISLTGSGGFQSSALSSLLTTPAGFWSFGGDLVQPIFNAGRIRSNVKLTEAEQQEALLTYKKTILESFREVSDSLIAYRKTREVREEQELLTDSARDALRLSNLRYEGGATSYLEVLDSDTRYLNAQLGLAQARLSELLSLVQIYQTLGGGWQDAGTKTPVQTSNISPKTN